MKTEKKHKENEAQGGGESGLQRNIKGRVGWGEENQVKSGQIYSGLTVRKTLGYHNSHF